jgi:homoserine kinase type II
VRRPGIEHCAGLGEALARFHLAGADFALRRANNLSLPGWRALFQSIGPRADEVARGLKAEIERELGFLEESWPADLPEGVIHADLFPDNVFFLSDKVSGLIDFYFACNDLLAYDVAICLNAWCFEPDASFNVTKARALLEAYEGVRKLTEAELDRLPVLARGAALRFLLTRTYDLINTDANALVKTKDPNEYLRKLRFHQRVKSHRAYGL